MRKWPCLCLKPELLDVLCEFSEKMALQLLMFYTRFALLGTWAGGALLSFSHNFVVRTYVRVRTAHLRSCTLQNGYACGTSRREEKTTAKPS